ncbi:MAG: glycosyltransferase family 1 protein [Rubrivivax sp.]|nr:glycosyltransferase family 1 protein [Rubrivivax sp.]
MTLRGCRPMNPLHVALVTETYPPEVNGVSATVSRVVEGLANVGHHVQLVRPRQHEGDTPGNGGGVHEHLARGMPIPGYPQLRMGLPCRSALVSLWRQQRPDVVHLVTEGPLGASALLAARTLKLPVVSDFRTNFHVYSAHYGIGFLRRPLRAYLRGFHNRTAVTMVPTEALRSELAATGFERLRVVARGVDTQRFNPVRRSEALRRQWGADERTLVALFVGRLAPEKNIDTVLAAFDALREDQPRARLVFVGDGPDRQRLQRLRPDAVFTGLQRGEALAAHYASADLFLFASLTETFGNVVPEAMASGLALLAYDHAAAAELVRHGENGLLAGAGDRATFCALARRLAGDGDRVRQLGLHARQTALGLDWGRIIDGVVRTYGEAIEAQAAAVDVPGASTFRLR